MSRHAQICRIEKKVRLSKIYSDWVDENKQSKCYRCKGTEQLECHHIVELYHVILGVLNFHHNEEETFRHVVRMHNLGLCESATLCKKCHNGMHRIKQKAPVKSTAGLAHNWTVIPRKFPLVFAQSTSNRKAGTIGLVGLQCMHGFGWHILNGNLDSRIVTVKTKKFAKLLSKTPGSSFKKSFRNALERLEELAIIQAYAFDGENVEIHFDPYYLDQVAENPWFTPLQEIHTGRMSVLTLKSFLSYLSGKRSYKIGLDKLALHLNLETQSSGWLKQCVEKSCEDIRWAKVTIKKDMCHFRIDNRGSVPIFTLRQNLNDSMNYGI